MYSQAALTLIVSLLSAAHSVEAVVAWTVNCGVLSIQRSDPIISPGIASGHVHAISGGNAFQRSMTGIDAAVDSTATTCDKFTDHSNYWAPQLYHIRDDGMFEMVPYTGVNSYYKNYTCAYDPTQQWCPPGGNAQAFPPGLRMVAGDSTRRTQNNSLQSNQAILWETGNNGEAPGFPATLADRVQLNVRFPSCWDGNNTDSPDHKSHMAYPDPLKGDTQGGMCPSTHPIGLISIGAQFGFATGKLGLTDSSRLVLANGDTTGFGAHADFIQGWTDLPALRDSFANCNGNFDDCAWNSFGTPDGNEGVKTNMAPLVAAPVEEEEEEEIGLNGPISKLPGDNPVYDAAASVVASGVASVVAPVVTLPTLLSTASSSTTVLPTSSVPTTLLQVTVTTSAPASTQPSTSNRYVKTKTPKYIYPPKM